MKLAKSYEGATIVKEYEKCGKRYAHIRVQCDRCTRGIYAIGVENGHIKPHPVANGVCFKCGGTGYLEKEARLYTEEEYARMEKANEAAREKKKAEQEVKMKAEFAQKKAAWIEKNGFNTDGITYIYAGSDSYSIKEQLKEDGYRFDSVLLWHKATKDEKYADKLIEVSLDEIIEFSAWGDGHFITGAKNIINEKIAGTQPQATSTWIGEVGEKIKDIRVQLIRRYSFDGKYGVTTVYTFQTEDGTIFTWFSSTFQTVEVGDWTTIKYATIKDHNEYKGVKSTVITRAKLI